MIDTKLRPAFNRFFEKMAEVMIKMNCTPDQITVIAFILGVFAAILTAGKNPVIALALLWLSGLMDVLDGTVARLTKRTSAGGALLDLILDRMVEAAMIFGFHYWMPEYTWMYLFFLTGVIFNFSTFLAAGSLYQNLGEKSIHYDSGLLERTETFIFFSLVLIFPHLTFYLFLIFNVLMFVTGIGRFYGIYRFGEQSN
ncbi:CDP-alcohol phosphatidyltransferase family protein [Isachenkonia alkalipeptolytica]|uniref:CDP-alcohol phosphatidyltransferase family protein n=1 Tax=Isachenkonia alkalipeptolytica TaxID=2565777 RepID=A0AA44BES2_9CLOT|nr:CDP-alcohol phosphatidyltransferase family protein [Isachenkonia alkalipeptolytica]NBG87836.1 CDP-alcohol phosphatidyltransferase family protein [Isachenkonia alkalipeptolytica]